MIFALLTRKNFARLYGAAGIKISRRPGFLGDRHGNVWIGASSDHGDGALVRIA